MRIAGLMICMPQDEEYILYSLTSLLPLDDIIITCPTKRMWEVRSNGMAIEQQDRTIAYLHLMKSEHPDKIHLIFKDGWPSAQEQWVDAFAKMKELGYCDDDSFILSMPDEVWDEENLEMMSDLCRKGSYNRTPVHKVFFGDFDWFHITGEGRNYRFAEDMVFDVHGGCIFKYPRHSEFNCKMGGSEFAKDISLYHFKWVHNRKHFEQKARWNNVYYAARPRKDPVQILEEWMKDKSISIQTNLDAAPLYVDQYNGNFSDLIKKHPYFGRSAREVLDYTGNFLL